MSDLISVIIPVYNESKYLDRCLASVLGQKHKQMEIILVDDGSTDESGRICDEYAKKDNRIKIIHKKNGGLSSARNAGIEIASGDYIGFVDSDDYIAEDMYAMLLKLIKSGKYDFASCGIFRTDGDRKEKLSDNTTTVYERNDFLKKILKMTEQSHNHYAVNKLYKRELFDNPSVRYPVGLTHEDAEGTFRITLKSKRIIETERVGYYYWVSPSSITTTSFGRRNLDLFIICDHLLELSREYGDEEIIKGAVDYKKRAYFGNLCKLAVSKVEKGFNKDEFIDASVKELRRYYFDLLRTNMSAGRKVVMTAMCINYRLTAAMLGKINKILIHRMMYRV